MTNRRLGDQSKPCADAIELPTLFRMNSGNIAEPPERDLAVWAQDVARR